MTCTRRSLTRFTRHLHPSVTHIPHKDRDRAPPPPRQSPVPLPRSAPVFGSLLRDSRSAGLFSLPLGLAPSLRSYSAGAEGSNEVGFINDVAGVLIDTGTEAAAVAVAIPAPVAGEVAAAAADSFLPVAALQHLIDGVHSLTGLNWWAAIALTTLLIRGATMPLLINQMKAYVTLIMSTLMRQELEELKQQQQMQNSMDPESVQEGQKRMKALFQKHVVTPFTPLKEMYIQGPLFVSFFFAISNMVEKVPSFKGGGAFWFTDLTTPDPIYMLPVLTSLTFWATVELNMQEGIEGNPMVNTMKNFSRVLALMTIPFTAHFPKAVFCYWITSNIFSVGYGLAMKRPPVRKFLNLPNLVPQTTSPSLAQPIEQSKSPDHSVSSSSIISHRIRNLEKTVKGRSKPDD